MGGNQSSAKQATDVIVTATLNVLNESITNCKSTLNSSQTIRIIAGDNSTINIERLTLKQNIASTLNCYNKIKLDTNSINKLTNDFANNVARYSEGIPELQSNGRSRSDVVTNIRQEATSKFYMKNVIEAIQSIITNQSLFIESGSGSTISIRETVLDNTVKMINDTVQDAASNLLNSVIANNAATNSNTNSNTPISAIGNAAAGVVGAAGNATSGVIGAAGNATSGVIDSAGKVASSAMSGMMIMIIVLAVLAFIFREPLMKLFNNSPIGRSLQ